MNGRTWRFLGGLTLLAWIGIGSVEAAPITPFTGPSSLTVSIFLNGVDVTDTWLPEPGQTVTIVVNGSATTPTISLVCPDGTTTAGCPGPYGPPFTQAPTLATSNYPGVCTNFGSLTDLSSDFTLNGNLLIPTDCGGRAVIQVTGSPGTARFLLPRDSHNNGLPDSWKAKYCASPSATCPNPAVDGETGTEVGDGFRAHDEYRGFIVSPDDASPGYTFFTDSAGNPSLTGTPRKHIRTSPLVKDIFIHLLKGQCQPGGAVIPSVLDTYPAAITPNATVKPSMTTGSGITFTAGTAVFGTSQIGGLIIGTGGGKARITGISGTSDPTVSATVVTADIIEPFPPAAATTGIAAGFWQIKESLFAAFHTLFPPTQVHLLSTTPNTSNSDQWVDTFVSLSIGAPGTPTANVAAFAFNSDPDNRDRQVNRNSVVGSPKQKGARLIECLDNQFPDPVGFASWEPLTSGFDNAVIYTRRIANATTPLGFIDSKIAAGGNRQLVVQIKKCVGTKTACPWGTSFTGSATGPTQADKDFLKTKYIQYIAAMELSHSIKVNPALGTYGPHDSPDSGDILGANAQIIYSNSPSGTTTFQIPAIFLKSTNRDFHLH